MRCQHPASHFLHAVCEARLGGRERQAKDVGNLAKTLVAIEAEPDDFSLLLRDIRQKLVDASELSIEVFCFGICRLGLTGKGNRHVASGFTLTADAKVGQHTEEVGRGILDSRPALALQLVKPDEHILHDIFRIVEIPESVASVLQHPLPLGLHQPLDSLVVMPECL